MSRPEPLRWDAPVMTISDAPLDLASAAHPAGHALQAVPSPARAAVGSAIEAPAGPVRRPNGWSNGVGDREPTEIAQAPPRERENATDNPTELTRQPGGDE